MEGGRHIFTSECFKKVKKKSIKNDGQLLIAISAQLHNGAEPKLDTLVSFFKHLGLNDPCFIIFEHKRGAGRRGEGTGHGDKKQCVRDPGKGR